MRTISSSRNVLLAVGMVLLLSLIAFLLIAQPALRVTVLNHGFRVLTAKISHGTTHKVLFGSWPESAVREQLFRWGLKVQRFGGVRLNTPNDSYAFELRYAGQLTRDELYRVEAELVDDSGAIIPLRGGARSYDPTKSEFARIWVLDSRPTNSATLRLTAANGTVPVAEIKIRAF